MNTFDVDMPEIEGGDDAVSERAAAFFERWRFGPWNDADQAELDAWLREATAHYVAWLRVESIAARTDRLAPMLSHELKRLLPVAEKKIRYRRFVLPLLAAASFAALAAIGLPLMSAWMQPADRTDSTDIGGRTLLNFADHTQVELNTDTAMRFRMTSRERTVWLDRGEAWFHVAHDAAHPFTVIVGRHRITDLGTEFLVRRDADNVDVALLSGRAALSAGGVQTAMLTPGDEALATSSALSVTRRTAQELADELAWRRGMLVFHNTPLADVVKQFNRYNTTKLVIADPSIADERIYADLKTDDYEGFLQLAEAALGLHVAREGSVILISREARDATKKAVRRKHGV